MTRTPIEPGEHRGEELKELGISAAELARQTDVPVNQVTGIVNGQGAITADTALRLGHWFGTSPEFWLNLQNLYELVPGTRTSWRSCEKTSEAHGTQARKGPARCVIGNALFRRPLGCLSRRHRLRIRKQLSQ